MTDRFEMIRRLSIALGIGVPDELHDLYAEMVNAVAKAPEITRTSEAAWERYEQALFAYWRDVEKPWRNGDIEAIRRTGQAVVDALQVRH